METTESKPVRSIHLSVKELKTAIFEYVERNGESIPADAQWSVGQSGEMNIKHEDGARIWWCP